MQTDDGPALDEFEVGGLAFEDVGVEGGEGGGEGGEEDGDGFHWGRR